MPESGVIPGRGAVCAMFQPRLQNKWCIFHSRYEQLHEVISVALRRGKIPNMRYEVFTRTMCVGEGRPVTYAWRADICWWLIELEGLLLFPFADVCSTGRFSSSGRNRSDAAAHENSSGHKVMHNQHGHL